MRKRGTQGTNLAAWLAISAATWLFLTASTCARAEDYQLLRIDGRSLSWRLPDSGHLTLSYAIVQDETQFDGAGKCGRLRPFHDLLRMSGLAATDIERAIVQAFTRWQRVINVSFAPATAGETPQIVLGAQASPIGTAFTSLQLAPSSGSTNHHIVGGAVCLNPERLWKVGFDGNLASFDLEYIFTHEIGHILGLDHPGARGHVMAFRYLETTAALSAGDITGAGTLYGLRAQAPVAPMHRVTRLARPGPEAQPEPR